MNADAKHGTAEILSLGYYPDGTALSEGGWPYLYSMGVDTWKHYILETEFDTGPIGITAKDDVTAITAFHSLYNLDGIDYIIYEKIVTTRTIERPEIE